MYLTAAELKPDQILTEYNGESGKFLKTFGMNNQRNKNEWRAPWSGIKEHAKSAIGMPGIAYEKCNEEGCGLDHVEADTYAETIEKQKPFHVTEIVGVDFKEDKSQVDFIHKVTDDDFWEKVQNGEIKYVSPMIWPATGGYDVVGIGRDNIPQVDAFHWKFVHHAFLEENPAFGKDANISATCEGDDCQVKLLSAKEVKANQLFADGEKANQLFADGKKSNQLFADTTEANRDNLSHLQEIPLLYRHKGKLHFVSASTCVQDIIKKKKDSGIPIDDQALAIAYSECGESQKANSSFKSCTCSDNHNMSLQALQAQVDETEKEKKNLESKLKGMEDEDHKEANYKASKSKFATIFKGMEEKDREDMIAKFRAAMSDDEHDKMDMKAMEENHDEMKSKKGQTEDPEKEDLKATLQAMKAKEIPKMITGLIAVRTSTGATKEELTNYHKALKAKSYLDLSKDFTENEPAITRLAGKTTSITNSFEFVENEYSGSSLAGKTLSETFGDEDE